MTIVYAVQHSRGGGSTWRIPRTKKKHDALDEQQRQGISADILRELDEEGIDREEQSCDQRDTPPEERTGQHDDHPQRPHGEDHRKAPEGDLTVPQHHPAAQQQVVQRHVCFAMAHDVDEAVPRRRGQGGADGLVEEEAVGAEEQRPEHGAEDELNADGQPPALCLHCQIRRGILLRR